MSFLLPLHSFSSPVVNDEEGSSSTSSSSSSVIKRQRISDPAPIPLAFPILLGASSLKKLPNELIAEIFSLLAIDGRARALQICHGLRTILSIKGSSHCIIERFQRNFDDSVVNRYISNLNFSFIKTINLENTQVTKLRAVFTRPMPNLTTLILPKTLEEELLDVLSTHCVKLRSLKFDESLVASRNLSKMILPCLTDLTVEAGHLREEDVRSLTTNSPRLQSLSLRSCDVSEIALSHLSFSHLRHLDLSFIETLEDLTKFNFPELETFKMACVHQVQGMADFFKKHPKLHSLSLTHFEIQGELPEFNDLQHLTSLDFSSNVPTQQRLMTIGKSCPNLRSLDLSNFETDRYWRITSEALELCNFPELTYLDCSFCDLGTRELQVISRKFPKLEFLDIRSMETLEEEPDRPDRQEGELLTAESLAHLALPELIKLRCDPFMITREALEALQKNCPKLNFSSIVPSPS